MRILHLIDPALPGSGACALAELAGILRHARTATHRVVLIGTRAHAALAARCGCPVAGRIVLPHKLPWVGPRLFAQFLDQLIPISDRPDVIVAWTSRAAWLAASAMRSVPAIARLSVGPASASDAKRLVRAARSRLVPILAPTECVAAEYVAAGLERRAMTILPPAVDLLTPGVAARADVRRAWRDEFGMNEKDFVVGLLGEPVAWPDTRMAAEIVARLVLAGRKVRLLVHHAAARRVEAHTLLQRLGMQDLGMTVDELAEPWRVVMGLDAALVLGVDFRSVGNAIRSAVRPGAHAQQPPPRRPAPSVSPILWAMSTGVPVVAHNLASAREFVVNDVTGLLVPEHDMNPASDCLARLYDDAMLRQRLTSAAAAQLSGDRLMPALADTLEHACEDIMNAPRADFAMVVA